VRPTALIGRHCPRKLDSPAPVALGLDLLHATLAAVSPPPPQGVHPELVLAAVVAERRRRDLDRLWREEQLRARVLPADPLAPRA